MATPQPAQTETKAGAEASPQRWYQGIGRYEWTVLAIASLGWVFDTFEGQIFVASMNEAMPELFPPELQAAGESARAGYLAFYNNIAFAAFLLGGAFGGVLFGILSDRIGRAKVMVLTVAMYSLFTCLSAFSQVWWHMAIFRFLVAMGVGGEWAVASSLVAEVFPQRARARCLAIFHASGVIGSLLAVAAGAFIIANPNLVVSLPFGIDLAGWRLGFVLGALPALLIVWIRMSLKDESEMWHRARAQAAQGEAGLGRFRDLFSSRLRRSTLVGVALAAVGLATFWGAHIYGKDVLRQVIEAQFLAANGIVAGGAGAAAVLGQHFSEIKRWEMLGMLLVTAGGGLGLVSFGPLCERLGRRGAFLLFHLGGFAAALILFQFLREVSTLLVFLPIFGFLSLGMHAGYAVYFPELFPTRLRGTGAGFCFNVGRILAAPILFFSGWLQRDLGLSLHAAASLLSCLFLMGLLLLLLAPETKGRELPE